MKQLIINADDFGLDETVNIGIVKGHTGGFITSTTIMPNGKAFDHAIALASQDKTLDLGIHLTLVGEKSLCDEKEVSSLVDYDGNLFPQYPQFLQRYLAGKVELSHIYKELRAQVKKVMDFGIPVSHLDSHQHLHIMPGIIDLVIEIAKEFGIKAIRIPREPYFFLGSYPCSPVRFLSRAGLTFLAQLAARKARQNALLAPDHFFGMLAGGNLQEEFLLAILDKLPQGVSEIMMHPGTNNQVLNEKYGWNYHGQEELAGITSKVVKERCFDNNIKLISFRDLSLGGNDR